MWQGEGFGEGIPGKECVMMEVSPRTQQIYERQVRMLPVAERLQLVRLVIDGLSETVEEWATAEEEWMVLGLNALQKEWDNPEDAVYDDWREAYDVSTG
jgi:hypothetical protein